MSSLFEKKGILLGDPLLFSRDPLYNQNCMPIV